MKIGIYNEPGGAGLGGSEVCVAVLAEALAKIHDVEILHSKSDMTLEGLSQFAAVDLSSVRFKKATPPENRVRAGNFWLRHLAERKEDARLSQAYDLFITFTHGIPPYCASPVGMVVVLFPFVDINKSLVAAENDPASSMPFFLRWLRTLWNQWQWRTRFKGYQIKVSISEFTKIWTRKRWNVDSLIVFPPVNVNIEPTEKVNRILSVGRFTVLGHGKKQLEMLQTYNQLRMSGRKDWQYDCAGGCGSSENDQAFLEKAVQMAKEFDASIHVNIPTIQLKNLYKQSKIFWHAAGMDVDENLHPELAEHFGITTVEAMAAGCVPVVINKGGQPEIVEHGVSGFLWNTTEELKNYTNILMQDDVLLKKMSQAARARARLFSRAVYVEKINALLSPYLDNMVA